MTVERLSVWNTTGPKRPFLAVRAEAYDALEADRDHLRDDLAAAERGAEFLRGELAKYARWEREGFESGHREGAEEGAVAERERIVKLLHDYDDPNGMMGHLTPGLMRAADLIAAVGLPETRNEDE